MWEIVIICTIFGVFIFTSFVLGLHYGSKIQNNEKINLPEVNPIKMIKENIKESKIEKKNDREQLVNEINLENIDTYDGTGIGQKDFPR